MRTSRLSRCIISKSRAPDVSGLAVSSGSSLIGAAASGTPAAPFLPPTLTSPVSVIASTFGEGERSVDALALVEEERRLARWGKLYDGMRVFEGGALQDHQFVGTRMIMRDYIQFALYHNTWGYFPKLHRKYRELMTSGFFDPVPFSTLRNQPDYQDYVHRVHSMTPAYVTPTQLFQPYYGWVVAEYLVSVYRAKFHPHEPFVIYDVGAGTGALAVSFLNFLAEHYPEMYNKVEYHVIEQSGFMVPHLRAKLVHHYTHVKIHHISILNWRQKEPRRCVVLGIELLSCMPHDLIYWTNEGECSEQWWKFLSKNNPTTACEYYDAVQDPVVLRYLRAAKLLREESFKNLKIFCQTDGYEKVDQGRYPGGLRLDFYTDGFLSTAQKMWYTHNPHTQMWIPTATMIMLEMMAEFFPRHHCFMADWSEVQFGLPGYNAPLAQIKIRIAKDQYVRRSVGSFMQNAGMVDLTFPTDFDMLKSLYKSICGEHKEVSSMSHPQFWRSFGGDKIALFATRSGYNPILQDFEKFHVFSAHHPGEL